MKATTAKDIPQEQRIFVQTWEFMKKYFFIRSDSEQDWALLMKEAHALTDPYKGTELERLAVNLICDATAHIERLSKARQSENK